MSDHLKIDPRLANVVLGTIEEITGQDCHIVMIVCPIVDEKLGQPTFLTSLHPDKMEELVTQIAGGFALAGKRHVSEYARNN